MCVTRKLCNATRKLGHLVVHVDEEEADFRRTFLVPSSMHILLEPRGFSLGHKQRSITYRAEAQEVHALTGLDAYKWFISSAVSVLLTSNTIVIDLKFDSTRASST